MHKNSRQWSSGYGRGSLYSKQLHFFLLFGKEYKNNKENK